MAALRQPALRQPALASLTSLSRASVSVPTVRGAHLTIGGDLALAAHLGESPQTRKEPE